MKIKNVFKNMTIRKRFTTSALLVVIFTMLPFEINGIKLLAEESNNNMNQKIEATSKLAALSFADPIWNLNVVGVRELSEALFQDKEVGSIVISASGIGEIYTKSKVGEMYDSKYLSTKTVEVLKEDMTIGEITIGVTNYYSNKSLQLYMIRTIIRIFLMIFFIWLAISFVSSVVTKSIYELSVGTDEILNGNLTHRLSIDSGDEIGQLADKFNSMTKYLYNMIKERDSAINELETSEEKFNKAFNYSTDAIGIVKLKDKQYFEINESFIRIFGYKREEITGHYSNEFNLWVYDKQHSKVIEKLNNGELLRNEEAIWRTKQGKVRVGLFSTEIIEIGDVPCIIFVWTDITERKKANEELKRSKDELESKVNERTKQLLEILMALEKQHDKLKSTQNKLIHSEKMASLGTLVAGVAHEISNPINYSYLSSKTLKKDFDCFKEKLMFLLEGNDKEIIDYFEGYFDKFSHSIDIISDGSNQIKTIVQDLRLFSRMDKATKNEMYIAEALETTIRLVKTQYIKQIKFTTNFQTDGKIECYPSQLKQVFLNIIVNACQAIEKKQKDLNDDTVGLININLLDMNNELIIEVSDNGIGMTEEVKSKIFEPFFTTKPTGIGTGLGLAISYGIIQDHNGRIEVESEEEEGTNVKIYLPHDINLAQQ